MIIEVETLLIIKIRNAHKILFNKLTLKIKKKKLNCINLIYDKNSVFMIIR